MCLTKKNIIPRIALKDIVVYKYLKRNEEGELCTIFTDNVVKIGGIYKGEFNYYDYSGLPSSSSNFIESLFSKVIDTGYIHSYVISENMFANKVCVKCIIPRGTLYFIGKDKDIASRKLKYVNIEKQYYNSYMYETDAY